MRNINWVAEVTDTEEPRTSTSKRSSGSSRKDRVESSNNTIFYYSEVDRGQILTLNKYLKNLEVNLINRSIALGSEQNANINLHINSYGGSVFAGFAALDYIKKSKVPVHTFIDGCAASAATMMSVVGAHRSMHEHAFMLIHQLSAGSWGKYEELKDDMKNNELLMKKIKEIYKEHTKIPKTQLNNILKHDLWWDAKTCLKYGLVDDIIT